MPVKNVLIVEDNPGDARLLIYTLSQINVNFVYRIQDTLAGALQELRDNIYDAVFLDLHLPDAHTPEEVVEEVKKVTEAVIVAVTGHYSDQLMEDLKKQGAIEAMHKDDIFHKNFQEALQRLENINKIFEAGS